MFMDSNILTKTSILPKLIFKFKPIKKIQQIVCEPQLKPKTHMKELNTKNSKTHLKRKKNLVSSDIKTILSFRE